MKKLLAVLLALCLGLCACAGADASGSVQSEAGFVTDDALLLQMREVMTQEGSRPNRVDMAETLDGDKLVLVDAEMLRDVAAALCENPSEPIEMDSLSNWANDVMIQGGQPYVVVQVYLTEPSGDWPEGQCVLWLQVGEQSKQYLYEDAAVFEAVHSRLVQNLADAEVRVEGSYTELGALQLEDGAWMHAVLEVEGEEGPRLVLVHSEYPDPNSNRKESVVYCYDPESGELELKIEGMAGVLRLEAADLAGYDYRVVLEDGTAEYWNVDDESALERVALPDAMMQMLQEDVVYDENFLWLRSFDIDAANSQYAYADINEVLLARGQGAPQVIMTSDDIDAEMLGTTEEELEGRQVCFQNPRFVCGGARLVLEVCLPGAQAPLSGVVVYDIASGEVHRVDDSFGQMLAGSMKYPTNTTGVMEAMESRVFIDFETLDARVEAVNPMAAWGWTADYETYVYEKYEVLPSGESRTTIYAESPDTPLLVFEGGQAHSGIVGVTKSYVVLEVGEAGSRHLGVLGYR